MRYKIKGGIIVRSENAAKPQSQPSVFLRKLIGRLPKTTASFDYGCGKLRYLKDILRRTEHLTIVDSEIQLSRPQWLGNRYTSIRKYMPNSNSVSVADIKSFRECKSYFDFGFCINVLSVIPIPAIRKRVIASLFEALREGGRCLFVVQYRNSDFNRMAKMKNAKWWREGILINSYRGYSYYAVLPPEKLVSMVLDVGFEIDSLAVNEGSAYLIACRPVRSAG